MVARWATSGQGRFMQGCAAAGRHNKLRAAGRPMRWRRRPQQRLSQAIKAAHLAGRLAVDGGVVDVGVLPVFNQGEGSAGLSPW